MLFDDNFPPPFARGVYRSRVRSREGYPVMFAVDSRGRPAGKVVIDRLTTPDKAERLLWARLDEIDPAPSLKLVKDTPEGTPPAHVSLALWGRLRRPHGPS